jgi:acetylornithine deacetylase
LGADLDTEQLLRQLVAIDSVSARSNGAVIDLLDQLVKRLGFSTQRLGYRDAFGIQKSNLIARAGPPSGPTPEGLALVGHTDTVPYDPAWQSALELRLDGDHLFGRGACDTKAFIACALTAASRIELDQLRGPLMLVFTADEEVGCLGAKQILEERAVTPAWAIIGEPTSLQPIRAQKGYCLAEVCVKGEEGHSAYPDRGSSAILGAGALLREVEAIAEQLRSSSDPNFEPPHTTVNVGVISGGKAKNIIPGECRFTLEWRPIPSEPTQRVPDLLRAAAERLQASQPGLRIEILSVRAEPGVSSDPDAPLVRFLETASGKKAGTISFGTEAAELSALGAETVVFGPGDIRVAHRTGEFVPRGELHRCAEVLTLAVRSFCVAAT